MRLLLLLAAREQFDRAFARKLRIAVIAASGLIASSTTAASQRDPVDPNYSQSFITCEEKVSNTPSDLLCQTAELERWDVQLNRLYKIKMARLPEKQRAAFRVEEQAWVVERDRKCDLEGRQEEGGTAQPAMEQHCRLRETANRMIALRRR